MRAAEREAYVLWWGRWLAAYTRQVIVQEAANVGPTGEPYILACLQEAANGLRYYFHHARVTGATAHDLTGMVRAYLYLAAPPVANANEDRAVTLGPPPQEVIRDGTRHTMRVPLSLLQAHYAARYGTNWLLGFLQGQRVDLPAGSPVPYGVARCPQAPTNIRPGTPPVINTLPKKPKPIVLQVQGWYPEANPPVGYPGPGVPQTPPATPALPGGVQLVVQGGAAATGATGAGLKRRVAAEQAAEGGRPTKSQRAEQTQTQGAGVSATEGDNEGEGLTGAEMLERQKDLLALAAQTKTDAAVAAKVAADEEAGAGTQRRVVRVREKEQPKGTKKPEQTPAEKAALRAKVEANLRVLMEGQRKAAADKAAADKAAAEAATAILALKAKDKPAPAPPPPPQTAGCTPPEKVAAAEAAGKPAAKRAASATADAEKKAQEHEAAQAGQAGIEQQAAAGRAADATKAEAEKKARAQDAAETRTQGPLAGPRATSGRDEGETGGGTKGHPALSRSRRPWRREDRNTGKGDAAQHAKPPLSRRSKTSAASPTKTCTACG